MAENEYLDSSKARRWQSVVQAIREGLAFVTKAKRNGCQWANLIDLPPKAA